MNLFVTENKVSAGKFISWITSFFRFRPFDFFLLGFLVRTGFLDLLDFFDFELCSVETSVDMVGN